MTTTYQDWKSRLESSPTCGIDLYKSLVVDLLSVRHDMSAGRTLHAVQRATDIANLTTLLVPLTEHRAHARTAPQRGLVIGAMWQAAGLPSGPDVLQLYVQALAIVKGDDRWESYLLHASPSAWDYVYSNGRVTGDCPEICPPLPVLP